ncbi:MAG: hypothetical protein AB8C13_10115, partial [Phycisphaerales bacterium]
MTKSTHETHTIKPHASPHARPGSAILIVVGTLALIAVFAAIYISIGQGDQRIADSIQKREEINANQDIFAEHILKVLGDDRLDYTAQRLDAANGIAYIRENTDAPYTDWTMRSETSVGEAWQRFNPSGRANSSVTQPSANDDFRVASDSWLAATSPTFLGDPGQPINGVDDLRPFGSVITEGSLDPSSFIANALSSGFLDKRDWLQISNLAPDGRFVNLFNLRQNQAFNDGTIGGFDAQTGFGTYTRLDGRTGRRMSEYLSLWNQESPGEPDSRIQTFDPSADGIWLPGRNLPETAHGITGDLANVPAVWTMYQRYMFMPLNQPFLTVNRNNLVSTWADPDFAAYQYADADGDGMADSRWIELVSAQEQAGGGSVRQGVERLYDAGRSRLFAGIRVVDLTSMVNVNTALDQLAQPEPSDQGVFGATPGDVDLRRFLSLSDPGQNYSVLQLAGLSPSSFHKPILTTNNDLLDVDYKWYRSYIDTTSPVGRKTIEPSSNTLSIGRYGYDALKRGLVNGDTLDSRYYAWPPELRALNSDPTPSMPGAGDFQDDFNPVDGDYDPNSNYRLNQFFAGATATEPLSARERRQWYLDYGRLNPIDVDPERSLAVPYGPEDLLEILAFHGLNDPSTVSRLEKSLMGRMPSIYEQNQRAFSPMLSNRPLALDRFRHGYVDQNNYGIAAPGDPREITGSIAKESMAFFSVTPRRLMTTVSGSAAILPGSVVTSTLPALTAVEAAPSLSGALSTPSSLFSVYSNALAGELNAGKVVGGSVSMLFEENIDDTRLLDTATLFYGHRGPELALRIAAHSAVNMTDLFDADQEPTAATLIIDDNLRNQLINDFSTTPIDSSDAEYGLYAGLAQGNLFDFGVSNLPDSVFTTSQAHRQAVNVFGIEPMPVLTEVSSMYVYMDSPMGDADFYDDGDPSTISIPRPPRPGLNLPVFPAGADGDPAIVEATIDGSVSETNEDLLMQVLAFQLTNPWDVSIQIGDAGGADQPMGYIDEDVNSPNNTNLNFDYYIEFGGRFFKLGQFVEFNPTDDRFGDPLDPDSPAPGSPITSVHEEYQYRSVTIAPNSSRVFYAIAHARFDAEEMAGDLDGKWTSLLGTSPDTDGDPSTGPAQEWVNEQFGVRAGDPATHIHQFDPRTGKLIEQGVFQDLLASPSAPADPVFENSDREHNFAQVRLWRKIRGTLEEVTTNAIPSQSIRDNLIQNDMLVDRISFSGGDLNRSLFAGNNPIEGSVSYDPAEYNQSQVNNVGVRNDNFGLTIARWATVRRGDNTEPPSSFGSIGGGGPSGDQAGQIAAWMLSSNRNISFNTIVSTDLSDDDGDGLLRIDDFLDGDQASIAFPFPVTPVLPGYEQHTEFNDLNNLSAFQEVIQTITRNPRKKYLVANPDPIPTGDSPIDFEARFPSLPLISNDAGQDLFATDSDLIPELLPNADGFNESPRLA